MKLLRVNMKNSHASNVSLSYYKQYVKDNIIPKLKLENALHILIFLKDFTKCFSFYCKEMDIGYFQISLALRGYKGWNQHIHHNMKIRSLQSWKGELPAFDK